MTDAFSVFPWQEAVWARLPALGRLPHAVLLAGPRGGGKNQFARALAARLLCETAQPGERACGACEACHWWAAGHHPDMCFVMPATEDDSADGAEKSAPASGARSGQIRIDQIRALADFLGVGAVRGGRRVVLISPAEAMNAATANALLKVLEEPPANTQFILVADEPRRLLPTVRSRTQVWNFGPPERAAAVSWLHARGVHGAEAMLDLAGGMPLLAADSAEQSAHLARFTRDVLSLPKADALALAQQWESWLKTRAGGVSLIDLVAWLQKWVFDMIAVKGAGRPRFFTAERERLHALASPVSFGALYGCYTALGQMRRVASHPLNPRLFLDDMLLRYARILPAR